MSDTLSQIQRSDNMSRIRGKNTKPEILVRKGLHARGFRFRLHNKKLPGSPDVVLPKYGVVIMVNGCFWHGHKGCSIASRPKSNREYWDAKIARNMHRDEVTSAHLEALGWKVITVWECELKGAGAAQARLDALAEQILRAGAEREQDRIRRKEGRMARRLERERMQQRQAMLQAELNGRYHVPRSVLEQSKEEES